MSYVTRAQVERPRGGEDEHLVVDADPLALDDEGAAEAVPADPGLRIREVAEDAVELVLDSGPDAVHRAPRIGQRRGDRDGREQPGQGDRRTGREDPRPHDRRRHLEGLVDPAALPAVLAVDESGAQPEQHRGDDEEQELVEEVGEGGRQVHDQRRAEQDDGIEHTVMAVDRERGGEGGREHQHAEADRVRRQLRRVAGAEHDDQPVDELGAQREQPAAPGRARGSTRRRPSTARPRSR